MLLSFAAALHVLASSAGSAVAAPDSLMGTGVSRALAVARAAQIRDVRYALSLDVTARDSALGRVNAQFRTVRGGDVILDFRGPRVDFVEVNGKRLATVEF